MADGGDSAQKILQAAPQQPCALQNAQMHRNRRFLWPINVTGPGASVGIRPTPQSRIQIELQMIVRVDQPWKDQAASEVQNISALRRLPKFAHGFYFAANDLDIQH